MFDRRRPDPQLGVFETLLVLDGQPVELAAHLARLEASLAELYPDRPPPPLGAMDVPSLMHPYRRPSGGTSARGSLRIAVAPGKDGELEVEVAVRDRPLTDRLVSQSGRQRPNPAVGLHSLVLDGGLGAHKWVDRSLLDEAQGRLPAGSLPLIVDRDGTVLEASRANLFAVRGDALLTPPTDGRILPGVTRARVLAIAVACGVEAHEAALSREDLLVADEVFLTGSVRGVEPVVSLDGAPLGRDRAVSTRLAAALRRAWTGEEAVAAFG